MTPQAKVVHQIENRARLSIAGRRGDQAYFDALEQQLLSSNAIQQVRSNSLTGSVLLEYAGPLAEALRSAGAEALFQLMPDSAAPRTRRAVPGWPPLRLASPHNLSSPLLLTSAALAFIGVVQTARGEVFVPASTAFWYAWNAYRMALGAADVSDPARVS